MAVFSKKFCKERLDMWLDAEAAIAAGQSYQIGTRMLTRASLEAVYKEIEYWARRLAEAEEEEQGGGYIRAFHIVPRDV